MDTSLKKNYQLKQLFVSPKDLYQTKVNELMFTKKKGGFLGWFDSNSDTINFDKLKLRNLDIDEV